MSDETTVASPSVALVRADDGRVALVPETTTDLYRFAAGLSRSGLIRSDLRGKPDDVMVICLTALELGVPLMTGLRQIAVINGRPFLEAQLLHALALRSGLARYVRLVESTPALATYETHRVNDPEPTRMSYGIEDAQRSGLAKRDTYQQHTAAMLRARCLAALLRAVYPDVAGGLYVHGEQSEADWSEVPVRVVQASTDATTSHQDGIVDPTLAMWQLEAEQL